jgi:hypothetical protein
MDNIPVIEIVGTIKLSGLEYSFGALPVKN